MSLHISGDPQADQLISREPLALVIAMVLDQQIPLEWAFKGPYELVDRLGAPLDAAALAAMDPEALVEAFSRRPALHRYPGSMAGRVQALCQVVVDDYRGDAARIWKTAADGQELLSRVKKLPGFGDQKARIFVALLGKQLGVTSSDWATASSPFGEAGSYMSVADIVDADSLTKVRQYKQAMKAAKKAAAVTSTVPAKKAPAKKAAPAGRKTGAGKKAPSPKTAAKKTGARTR
ncbi:MAG TPA: HhH-GPD-type base excision DNA repair protein [Acidimicrobiales bacterium]